MPEPLTYQHAAKAFADHDRQAMGIIILEVARRVAATFTTADRDALAGDLAIFLWQKLYNCRRAEVVLDFLFTVARFRAIRLVNRERSKAKHCRRYQEAAGYALSLKRRQNRRAGTIQDED